MKQIFLSVGSQFTSFNLRRTSRILHVASASNEFKMKPIQFEFCDSSREKFLRDYIDKSKGLPTQSSTNHPTEMHDPLTVIDHINLSHNSKTKREAVAILLKNHKSEITPQLTNKILHCLRDMKLCAEALELCQNQIDVIDEKSLSLLFDTLKGTNEILVGIEFYMSTIQDSAKFPHISSSILLASNAAALLASVPYNVAVTSQSDDYVRAADNLWRWIQINHTTIPVTIFSSLIVLAGKTKRTDLIELYYHDAIDYDYQHNLHLINSYLVAQNFTSNCSTTINFYLKSLEKYNVKVNSKTIKTVLVACRHAPNYKVLGLKIFVQWVKYQNGEPDWDLALSAYSLSELRSVVSESTQTNTFSESSLPSSSELIPQDEGSSTITSPIRLGKVSNAFDMFSKPNKCPLNQLSKDEIAWLNSNHKIFCQLRGELEHIVYQEYVTRFRNPGILLPIKNLELLAPLLATKKALSERMLMELLTTTPVNQSTFTRIASRSANKFDSWRDIVAFLERLMYHDAVHKSTIAQIIGLAVRSMITSGCVDDHIKQVLRVYIKGAIKNKGNWNEKCLHNLIVAATGTKKLSAQTPLDSEITQPKSALNQRLIDIISLLISHDQSQQSRVESIKPLAVESESQLDQSVQDTLHSLARLCGLGETSATNISNVDTG